VLSCAALLARPHLVGSLYSAAAGPHPAAAILLPWAPHAVAPGGLVAALGDRIRAPARLPWPIDVWHS